MSQRQHIVASVALALAVGVLGLSQATWAAESSGAPVVVLRLVNKGQVRLAHREVTKMLANNPSNPELHAAYGAVLATGALYPDAVLAFEDSLGSSWYERTGYRHHAKSLGRVGRGEEAVALRSEFAVVKGSPETTRSLTMYGEMVEDLVESGAELHALSVAEEMVLEYPDRGYSWAHLAWVQVLLGELDEASWSLLMVDRYEAKDLRVADMARAAWMMHDGRYVRADHELQSQWKDGFKDADLWWLRLEIMRRSGFAENCVNRAELPRFEYQEEPSFIAVYSRCLDEVGRRDEAVELLRSSLVGHPGSRWLRSAADELQID